MTANDATVYLAFATRLRTKHRRLAEVLYGLEQPWAESERPRDMPTVVSSMEFLRSELARHFEEERAGGCLDEAVSRLPSLGPEADGCSTSTTSCFASWTVLRRHCSPFPNRMRRPGSSIRSFGRLPSNCVLTKRP